MCLPGCLFVCHLILLLMCFLFNCIDAMVFMSWWIFVPDDYPLVCDNIMDTTVWTRNAPRS